LTVTLLAIGVWTVAVDESARRFAATVAIALKRADVTQDYVSRVTGIPPNKLSNQLAGKVPFTGLVRILASRELRDETDFWLELMDLLADGVNRALVPMDLGYVIAKLELLVGAPRMVKAQFRDDQRKAEAV
jgi:hypothetical protein